MNIKDALIKRLSLSNDEHASLSYANFKRGKATTLLAISFYLLFFYQLINSALRLSPQRLFYFDITFYFCLPLITIILLYRTDKALFCDFLKQLKPPSNSRILPVVLIAIVLGIIDSLFFGFMESLFREVVTKTSNTHRLIDGWGYLKLAANVFYAAITAALVEEMFYKPIFFYLTVKQFWLTQKQAIFASVALFTLVHIEQGFFAVVVTGLCYALPTTYYYAKTRNIFALVVLHFTSDLVIFTKFYFFH